jgi:hypothetical protein
VDLFLGYDFNQPEQELGGSGSSSENGVVHNRILLSSSGIHTPEEPLTSAISHQHSAIFSLSF